MFWIIRQGDSCRRQTAEVMGGGGGGSSVDHENNRLRWADGEETSDADIDKGRQPRSMAAAVLCQPALLLQAWSL